MWKRPILLEVDDTQGSAEVRLLHEGDLHRQHAFRSQQGAFRSRKTLVIVKEGGMVLTDQ